MSLSSLLIPTYIQMLQALSSWLDKACKQLPEKEAQELLSARLTPDMYPLSSQIRFACLQAQEAQFRLRRELFPDHLDHLAREGQNAGAQPGSISAACTRINEALTVLRSLEPGALDMCTDQMIELELPNGMTFDMTGEQYARDWALPQFYFHLNTAYAILRAKKIDLGKADYVQHAFTYLRIYHPEHD
ncbi:DUF1993 domain-containing protein [Microbulbifer sp. MLAF003]|uniref:DUF1993 domain-containing protein n=1 Tax=Microbulbifer sp. MLAF003 TaxID=3032582 RepID=UPI0024AD764E|nr:DUF1993 domain-containing protein [Microbulbifer sp. MLAF003]WHI49186.1 DUF1993 domain-containing protein [Microbulbifer sp. MLAF003]